MGYTDVSGRATPASRRTAYRIFTLSAPSGFRTPDPLVFIQAWTISSWSLLWQRSRRGYIEYTQQVRHRLVPLVL